MIWTRLLQALRLRSRRAEPAEPIGVSAATDCLEEHATALPSDPMTDGYPWNLLARHAAGETSAEEAQALTAWTAEDGEHARLLRRMERLVEISRTGDAVSHTDEAWDRLQRRTGVNPAAIRFPSRLTVSPDRPRRTALLRGAMAAGIALAFATGGFYWWRQPAPLPVPQLRQIAAARGQRLEFGLPDGSRVVLGAESRLAFDPGRFAGERTLTLTGEGYFAVAHDTTRPFIVFANGSAVQAVGTAFVVRAFEADSMVRVAVEEGRVLLRAARDGAGTGTILNRGDLGQRDGAGRIALSHDGNLGPWLGWVHGRLQYDLAPLQQVAQDLERWYDLDIEIEAPAQSLEVTLTLDPTQPAGVTLRRLAEVLDLGFTQTGRQVRFAGRLTRGS